ncbi:MAG: secretin N-terminal domain-containing protein [Gemmatimonadales bacterium]
MRCSSLAERAPRRRGLFFELGTFAGAFALAACTHTAITTIPAPTKVRTEPAPVATQSIAPSDDGASLPLTSHPASPSALADAPLKRVSITAPEGSDIADVARQVGKSFGLNVAVDPDVHGKVMESLHDVTLDEALQTIVRKNGFAYQIQGRTLRVTPVRLSTRIFTLDYVALSRVGTANTVIQRRLSSGANNASASLGGVPGLGSMTPGSGLSGAPGGDVIAATQVSDLWMELRIALMGLLSRDTGPTAQGAPGGGINPVSGQPNGQQNGAFAGAAFATTWPDGSALTLSPSSGLITVTATDDKLADVQTYIESFQSSVLRQVLIEAKIVEVQLTKELQYGIDWSVVTKSGNKTVGLADNSTGTLPTATSTGQTGNVAFSLTGGATQINAVLTALATQGDVTVLSDARTSALNNQRAVFDVTTDEVFFAEIRQPLFGPSGGIISFNDQIQAQTISVGIVLDVLPQISSQNVLTMNIRPVVTSLDRVETFTAGDGSTARFPVTSRREGDTMARVRNGETIVIGGLMQNQRTRNVSGVPVLKDIPLLGKLFTHVDDVDKRVELVVFLTPTVITGQPGVGR